MVHRAVEDSQEHPLQTTNIDTNNYETTYTAHSAIVLENISLLVDTEVSAEKQMYAQSVTEVLNSNFSSLQNQ